MSLRAKMMKSGIQVAFSQLGQQLLLMLRSVIVARLLPEQQFGIALTFMTVLTALDALTDIGVELYIVRAKEKDTVALQRTLQAMMIMRGLLAGLGLFLVAGYVAELFGVPEQAWAYRWLAVIPILRSFLHLDFRRYERDFRFWPGTAIGFIAQAINVVVSVAIAWKTGHPIAIVAGAAAQMVAHVIGSHIVAERKYELAYDKSYAASMFSYGMPLILNGVLLFSLSQGDRVVVGSILGVRELEHYGVVTILTSGITILIMRVTGAIYLPLLAEHEAGSSTYLKRYEACGAFTALMSIAVLVPLAFVGHSIVELLFGSKFAPTSLLVTLLAAQVALKVMRSWPQRAFLANAQTSLLFFSNLIAATGLLTAAFAAYHGYGIEGVAACMALSELIAALHSIYVVGKNPGILRIGLKFVLLVVAAAAALTAMHYYGLQPQGRYYEFSSAFIGTLLCSAAIMTFSPYLNQFIRSALKRR